MKKAAKPAAKQTGGTEGAKATRTISAGIPIDFHNRIEELAALDYRKPANIVIMALEHFLPIYERQLLIKRRIEDGEQPVLEDKDKPAKPARSKQD